MMLEHVDHLFGGLARRAVARMFALRHPSVRRRFVIVLSGVFICLYACAVLVYVLTTPNIGLHCPFSTHVSRVLDGFRPPDEAPSPGVGDKITKLGNLKKVESWQQLVRQQRDLGALLSDPRVPNFPNWGAVLQAAEANPDLIAVRVDRSTWVRVEYERASDGISECGWQRLGRPGVETIFPSVLWFLLKLGLFVVGALVFWNRPEDPSAVQFFVMCLVTIGAFIGG